MSAQDRPVNLDEITAMLESRLQSRTQGPVRNGNGAGSPARRVEDREHDYRNVIESIRRAVAVLPPGAVAVVSKGDPDLLDLGRPARHFPETVDGTYLGYHPSDGPDVIARLERARQQGARYLLFPRTSYWWLSHYTELVTHLERTARLIHNDGDECLIYELTKAPSKLAAKKTRVHVRRRAKHERFDRRSVAPKVVTPQSRMHELCSNALAHDPDLAALFDPAFYLRAYPDVMDAGADPLVHYLTMGWVEERDPGPFFDTSFYLRNNPDVAAAGLNPLLHYLSQGAQEGRQPYASFNATAYTRKHAHDLGSVGNPLAHFVTSDPTARLLSERLRSIEHSGAWNHHVKQLVHSMVCFPARERAATTRKPTGRGTVVVSHDAEINGAQLIALSVARELADRSADPLIVILKRGGPLQHDFAKVAPTVVLGGDTADAPDAFDRLVGLLADVGVSTALCNSMVSGDVAAILKAQGMKVVSMIHELPSGIRTYASAELLEQSIAGSDHVVFPARFVRDHVLEEFQLTHASTWVMPQGIIRPNPFLDERHFARLQVAKELDIPEDSFIVMGCGLASQRKGFDVFVHVARAVAELTAVPCHFVWVGPDDGDFTRWCLHDANTAGVEELVHITGLREHPGLYYVASDAFVLTSREDPFPTVCMEAMEASLPVLAFEEVGGIGELVTNEVGALLPYLDARAMAHAVAMLAEEPELRERLGRQGRAAVADLNVSAYVTFLSRLLTGRRSVAAKKRRVGKAVADAH